MSSTLDFSVTDLADHVCNLERDAAVAGGAIWARIHWGSTESNFDRSFAPIRSHVDSIA